MGDGGWAGTVICVEDEQERLVQLDSRFGFDGQGFLCMGMMVDVFQRVGTIQHHVHMMLSTEGGEFGCTLLDDPHHWSLPWCAPDHLPAHVFHKEGAWVFWIREVIWSPAMLYSPLNSPWCKSECKRCSGFQ